MHVLRADGTYGMITGWKIVPGVKTMYNLEVAQDHTFTVGIGQWVVHNCSATLPEMAQTFANQAKQAMVSKYGWFFKKEATVGVAYMVDDEGAIEKVVALNDSAVEKWGDRVANEIGTPIEGSTGGSRHAEEVLVDIAKSTGRKIIGIGASTGFCGPEAHDCMGMLLREVGQQFLGQ